MVINHNMSAMFANRMESMNTAQTQKELAKLSSGQKINSAGDDAAGLAISEKMRSQIRGLNQASRNASTAINFVNVSEGYLAETTDVLQRIRELAVQSSNGVYSDEDRMMIQVEVSQLVSEVDRIAGSAQFNGMTLLTGRFAEDPMRIQVGANADQAMTINIKDMSASALGLIDGEQSGLSIASAEEANNAIATIDEALKTVNGQRAGLGAVQNRLEMTVKGLDVAAENMTASESRIRDADMAEEMVNFVRDTVLTQASTSMLAQANSQNAAVLSLLR